MNIQEVPLARFQEKIDDSVICKACMRFCRIRVGGIGICGNYMNTGREIINIGYGILSVIESRPIEIKPFYHYWPGSTALTFSNFGCNFYCPWCQNYSISFRRPPHEARRFQPSEVVESAVKLGDEGVCASFNEPSTQVDFLIDAFSAARSKGLYSTVVTNGYFSKEALECLVEAGCDGFSVDVKGCPKAHERYLKGINPYSVLKNAKLLLNLNAHVEVVFLLVPGFNDDEECISWLINNHLDLLGNEVPLHLNRYYPAHRYNMPATPIDKLLKAKEIARNAGIEYVYVGNTDSPTLESTYCPNCGKLLIERRRYRVTYYSIDSGRCKRCNHPIPIRGKYIKNRYHITS
ncbi:MAG: radical SAM protein [Nitrososphaerota archaeon]